MTVPDVSIISASAGTGKTHKLMQLVIETIKNGKISPENILLTTFTEKAAAELRERVCSELVKENLISEARRFNFARMGTINSICMKLLKDFCFEIGLSPNCQVLDEQTAVCMIKESVFATASADELLALDNYEEKFSFNDGRFGKSKFESAWLKNVLSLISAARYNRISPSEFSLFARRSADELLSFLPVATKTAEEIDKEALSEYLKLSSSVIFDQLKTKKEKDFFLGLQKNMSHFDNKESFPWKHWQAASNGPSIAKKAAYHTLMDAFAQYDQHPRFHKDIRTFLSLIYKVAAAALTAYQERKLSNGWLDFDDQKTYALELLERQDIAEYLSHEIKVVMVDEFQDTDPLELAIFLKIAQIAKKSYWVGDPKQCLFAFKGCDPALIKDVATLLTNGNYHEILNISYRSRSPLVRVMSEIFSQAFLKQEIPGQEVELQPVSYFDDPQLGSAIEFWKMKKSGNRHSISNDCSCIAGGIKELLRSGSEFVRDYNGKIRQVQAGDIAVLCRTNSRCSAMVKALQNAGIPCNRSKSERLASAEYVLIKAGLKLWLDSRDMISRAEIARLATFVDDPDGWFDEVFSTCLTTEGFCDASETRAIVEASRMSPEKGIVSIIDEVVNILHIDELCHRLGNKEIRYENVAWLYEIATTYAQRCDESGEYSSIIGFLNFLKEVENEADNNNNLSKTSNSVSISTIHAAKGLEWPITVVYIADDDLGFKISRDMFGVETTTDAEVLDLDDTLNGRWVKYWPWVLGNRTSGVPLVDALTASPKGRAAQEKVKRENRQLLYVAFTRARDRLIIPTREDKSLTEPFEHLLDDQTLLTILSDPNKAEWGSVSFPACLKELEACDSFAPTIKNVDFSDPPICQNSLVAAIIRPSEQPEQKVTVIETSFSTGVAIKTRVDDISLGNAFHSYFAVDTEGLTNEQKNSLASEILHRWGVDQACKPGALVKSAEDLAAFLLSKWPNAIFHREWPVLSLQSDNSILSGRPDLILETSEGFVIIDHKTVQKQKVSAQEEATIYSGQMKAYSDAIAAATGKPIAACLLHLPIQGQFFTVNFA